MKLFPLCLLACAAPFGLGQTPPLPFHEGFDDVTPPSLPSGWISTQNRAPGTNDFTTTPSTPRSAPHAVLSTNATIGQSLTTPLFDFTDAVPESVTFYVRRSSSHVARAVLEASTDGGDTFPLIVGDTLRGTGTTNYVAVRAPLPQVLAGRESVRLRWRIIPDAGGPTGTFRLDDISVTIRKQDDLEATDLHILPVEPGDSLDAVMRIRNAGTRTAGACTADFFLDLDGDSTGDAPELLGSAELPAGLGTGDSAAAVLRFRPGAAGVWLLVGTIRYAPDQDTTNNRAAALLTVAVPPRSLAINEILYAPTTGDPEWVELLNRGTRSVDLRGWMIGDETVSGRRTVSAATRILAPGTYVVLTRDSAQLRGRYPSMPPSIISVAGFPALNNTGDAVVLADPGSRTVDSVRYDPSWGGGEGGSLERMDPDTLPNDPANWGQSADPRGATPGSGNSIMMLDDDLRIIRFPEQRSGPGAPALVRVIVRNMGRNPGGVFAVELYEDADGDSSADGPVPVARTSGLPLPVPRDSCTALLAWEAPPAGSHRLLAVIDYPPDMRPAGNSLPGLLHVGHARGAVIVNEIMARPVSGSAEYVELMNVSGAGIALAGWRLRGMSGSTLFDIGGDSARFESDALLLVASDSTIFLRFPHLRTAAGVHVLNRSLGLNNDCDSAIVVDPAGLAVDSVVYDASWHNPGLRDPAGRSLERIRPGQGSNDPRNWSSCASPAGGTPGLANSIHVALLPSAARLSVSPNPFSPDGDGREDFAIIRFHLPLQTSMIRVRLYDVRGRLIRTLAGNEPAGAEGEVIWNGMDDEGRRVRMGIYVILLEAVDDRGGVLETVKGVVVAAGVL